MPVKKLAPFVSPSADSVRAARVALAMSQPEFATLLRSSVRSVQEWEGGRRNMHPGVWRLLELELAARGVVLPTASGVAPPSPGETVGGMMVVG
jgi:ribosome-binding protein aMBF1 (putative translation factor)